ncbi:hypothetical protein [Acidihalobacter ferrooxydans]|uniref:hypothetical protein n=1 Tax=Acidihalobacter ferrooxydans TaxID=1765967 RepID=UPI0012EB8CC5|nr:hypothetical protein [Acidihalobacter ferrooxydans]
MFKFKKTKVAAAMMGLTLLAPASAFAGMLYNLNGYAPNASSPVVGGWAQISSTSVRRSCRQTPNPLNPYASCGYLHLQITYVVRPFGDVQLLQSGYPGAGGTLMKPDHGWWNKPARYATEPLACPSNTAKIQVSANGTGAGYKADNGAWYNTVYIPYYPGSFHGWAPATQVYVCVNTDTGQGQYGGQ